MEILNTSAYESPALMVILFVLGSITIYFMLMPKGSEQKESLNYHPTKRELPSDDTYEQSSSWVWFIIILGIVFYLFFV